jgi:fructose-bisphosphate aldolase class II
MLAISQGASNYMGGLKTVINLVTNLLINLKITVPVSLHLDHCQTVNLAKEAIDLGYPSIMFDGSHLPFEENLKNTQELLDYARENKKEIAFEVEIGTIGGEEDGIIASGEISNLNEVKKMEKLPITMLAIGINNVHGEYPKDWKSLRFDVLKNIREITDKILVLHGGSGIPKEQIQRAISEGINKININTECQIAFSSALKSYFDDKKNEEKKGYDPRKILNFASQNIKKIAEEYFKMTGSQGKAN